MYRPEATKTEPQKATFNTIVMEGMTKAKTEITLKQKDKDLDATSALWDSGSNISVNNLSTTMRMGLNLEQANDDKNRDIMIANGGDIVSPGTASATKKQPDNKEYPITIHISPYVVLDTLLVSCNVMIQM